MEVQKDMQEIFGNGKRYYEKTKRYLYKKYSVDLEAKSIEDNIKLIEEAIWGKKSERTFSFDVFDDKGILENCVVEAESYRMDVVFAIFMYLGYKTSKNKELKGAASNVITEIDEIREEEKSSNKGESSSKEEGAKNRYSSKILENFPFEIKYDMGKGETNEYKVWKCSSWCRDYQNEMLGSDNNAEIFAVDKDSTDISRYGFIKSKKIFRKLKETEIENILFYEISTGYKLTNKIYPYLREMEYKEKIDELEGIFHYLCKIPCIKLGTMVSDFLLFYLYNKKFEENSIQDVYNFLENIVCKIEEYFLDLCRLMWCSWLSSCDSFLLKDTKDIIVNWREDIERWWNGYFSPDETNMINDDHLDEYELTELAQIAITNECEVLACLADSKNKKVKPYKEKFVKEQSKRKITSEFIQDLQKEMLKEIDVPQRIEISKKQQAKLSYSKRYAIIHRVIIKYKLEMLRQYR